MFDENQTVSFFNSENFRESGVHLAAGNLGGEGGNKDTWPGVKRTSANGNHARSSDNKHQIQNTNAANTKYNLWASRVKSCYPYAALFQRKRIINDQWQVALLCVRFPAYLFGFFFSFYLHFRFRFLVLFSALLFAFCIFFTLTQYCLFVGRLRKAQHKPPNDCAALGSWKVGGRGGRQSNQSSQPNTHIRCECPRMSYLCIYLV